ncbi:MAG: hypothetical protein LBE91_19680 [Tannerella sp.]|jgi:hypothetical protein|nr:hypothetical protein [Tannerella sp.]
MGFLSNMNKQATQQWAENLTLEQIEEWEKQGLDMSEYRIIFEERQAEQQRIADSIDLSMLDKFKETRTPDFVEDVAKFNKLSDRKKQELETAPLVYGRVVQAFNGLFKPNPKGDGGIVFLYALDGAHRYDVEWLAKTANRISEMKESVENQPESTTGKIFGFLGVNRQEKKKVDFLPEDCREFIGTLCNDTSAFRFHLGKTLSDGADAWCSTYTLWEQSKLPMAQIPPDRIVPFLLTGERKEGYGGIDGEALLIPPVYYMK